MRVKTNGDDVTTPPRKRGRPTGPPQVHREISLPVKLDAVITSTALPPRGYSRRVVELLRLGLGVERAEADWPACGLPTEPREEPA